MGDKNFRLPLGVRPVRYTFVVVPDLEARTFAGRGTIEVQRDDPSSSLTLHAARIAIATASLRTEDAAAPIAATVSLDEASQTATISWAATLPAGRLLLDLAWSGRFQDDLRGLYLAGGVAVTQFEAADARRVFPCFDEPAFKAVWDVSLEVPEAMAVVGNGRIVAEERLAGGRKRVRFAETPTMSSYLVAFAAGDLVASPERLARSVSIHTWSTRDKAHLSDFAQECAASVLPLLEDYFGLPYAFGKLDQLGIPEFEAGAMENSGCITFREVILLVDTERAPLTLKKRAAEVITHELAHQWFGNLVTMRWWDDLWLNEAFATWMAFKVVAQWQPAWRMWDDFDGGKAAALHLDAMESTHAIHAEVQNAEQATENFDVITYEKGGAMLRMIEGYLGEDRFRDGIRGYMREHAYDNAVADDLWDALGRVSGEPIREVASAWIHQAGFPLVELTLEEENGVTAVHLEQRRFLAEPAGMSERPTDDLWPVPAVLRWADDAGLHETRALLRGRRASIELPVRGALRFVYGNRGGAGFYRVRHDGDTQARLLAGWRELAPVERMNLVSDGWALFRAGVGTIDAVLDLLVRLAADRDYAVLGEVVGRLEGIERRFVDEGARHGLRQLVGRTFDERFVALGFSAAGAEGDDERLERAQVARAVLLVARSAPAVAAARGELRAHLDREPGHALDPNLYDAVHIAAARAGDAALFDELLGRMTTESDPAARRRFLIALASFEEPALVERALALIPTDAVPMQDVATFVGTLLAGTATRDRAFEHLRDHFDVVLRKAAAPMLLRRIVESLGDLASRRAEVEALLAERAHTLAAVPQALRQARERLRLDAELRDRAIPAVHRWLDARGPALRRAGTL